MPDESEKVFRQFIDFRFDEVVKKLDANQAASKERWEVSSLQWAASIEKWEEYYRELEPRVKELEIENRIRATQIKTLKQVVGVSWTIFVFIVGAGWVLS